MNQQIIIKSSFKIKIIYKKLFGCINHHQLLNEYVLHNFVGFSSNIINCQGQLKTIEITEKRKNKHFLLVSAPKTCLRLLLEHFLVSFVPFLY